MGTRVGSSVHRGHYSDANCRPVRMSSGFPPAAGAAGAAVPARLSP